jgi:hypothetical protein
MKHILRLFLTLLMVVSLAVTSSTPVFAEDAPPPPPPQNPDGTSGTVSKADTNTTASEPSEASPAISQDAGVTADFTRQPNYSPDGAATSGMGIFQGESLVNTSGDQVLPGNDLSAQSTSYAMACAPGSIPIWYPGGTCNNTEYTLLQDAIDAALPGWTVWMDSYYSDGTDIAINKTLTLQGDPYAAAFIGDTNTGYQASIAITASGVTIRSVMAYGQITQFAGYSGTLRLQDVYLNSPNWNGLWVANGFTGSVILSQVYASGNFYDSMIDLLAGNGTVTILNSKFEDTYVNNGLRIYAKNTVKLENVTASGNWGDGMYIEYAKGLTVKNSVFNDNFNGNFPSENPNDGWGFGLLAYDVGTLHGFNRAPVLLQNVTATGNDETGISLENTGAFTIQNAGFYGNAGAGLSVNGYSTGTLDGVTAKDNGWSFGEGTRLWLNGALTVSNSAFEYNFLDGLFILTNGAVTLKGVKSSYNDGHGAYVYAQGAVNVLGGYYDSNDFAGLYVSTMGTVTLNGVLASWNNWTGDPAAIEIDNCRWNGSSCAGTGNVTLTNTLGQNVIANNYRGGLTVDSRGTISINTLSVYNNRDDGIDLDNCQVDISGIACTGVGNVTLTNVLSADSGYNPNGTENTSAFGLGVFSNGTITLDKVTADHNTAYGISLNGSKSTSAKTVTLKNVYALNNGGSGVNILGKGAVSINHINSYYNNDIGLTINTLAGVTITNTLGANLVDSNNRGVTITSSGTVSINGLSASNNLVNGGIYVDIVSGSGSATITNSRFNANNTTGLEVYANGNITLKNVQGNENITQVGAWLQNNGEAGKSVTVSNSTFNSNGDTGLGITAGGTVTLNGVSASYNHGSGLYVRNDYFKTIAAYNVTILSTLGMNMFNNNDLDNVYVRTSGNVSISKATASNSYGSDGFHIYFTGDWSGKSVTFTCSTADANLLYGIYVDNGNSNPINLYLNGSGATGNKALLDYFYNGNTIYRNFTRTNCP